MTNKTESDVTAIKVLLADSRPIESQLLAGALLAQGFSVTPCETLADRILQGLETSSPDIIVFGLPLGNADVTVMRTVHLVASQIPKVLLLDCENRDIVVQAFRAGARGIFCLAESSFRALCECIEKVYRGEIWASNRQFSYLLDSVCQLPGLPVMSTTGEKLLTSREEQVVALVADGLSNRNIAAEMGLSEHTVKKYLFRIFDKLGISNRVELVLYAVHHGGTPRTGWLASA